MDTAGMGWVPITSVGGGHRTLNGGRLQKFAVGQISSGLGVSQSLIHSGFQTELIGAAAEARIYEQRNGVGGLEVQTLLCLGRRRGAQNHQCKREQNLGRDSMARRFCDSCRK